MKQKEQADIDALAKDYATVNYARAAKQSEDDAEYIQAVSYYSFLAGYQSKQVAGEWVKASERLPVGRKPAVNIYLQEVGWLNILTGGAVFETIDKVFYDYEFSEEKLYNHIYWLDESQPPKQVAQAGNDAVDGWISVEDRLPNEDQKVIVNVCDVFGDNFIIIARRNNGEWYAPFKPCDGITHWRSLPQPPKQ